LVLIVGWRVRGVGLRVAPARVRGVQTGGDLVEAGRQLLELLLHVLVELPDSHYEVIDVLAGR
jgi:hypothetical protein